MDYGKVAIFLIKYSIKPYYMPYIENPKEALFFIVSKLVEIASYDTEDFSKTPLRKLERILGKKQYHLSNSFEYRNEQISIRSATFYSIIDDLLRKKFVVGVLDYFSTEDLYQNVEECFKEAVKLARIYPDAPYIELATETTFDFLIRDKKSLGEYLFSIPPLPVKQEEKAAYRVEYNDRNRKILINSILLSRPNFDSLNHIAFDYIYKNPNKIVNATDIPAGKDLFKKSLIHVIRDLGFQKELKSIFFPGTTKRAVKFMNPVHEEHLEEDLKKIPLNEIIFKITSNRKNRREK